MVRIHREVISINSSFEGKAHTKQTKEKISEHTLEYNVHRMKDGVIKQTYHDLWDAVDWVKSHRKSKAKNDSIYKRIQFAIYGCNDTKSAYGYDWELAKIPGKELKEDN